MSLDQTRLFLELQSRGNTPAQRAFLSLVETVFQECLDRTRAVVLSMPEFTLHDERHLLGVVARMGLLLPDRVLSELSSLEIGSLILSAGLHDLGMAPIRDLTAQFHEAPDSTEITSSAKSADFSENTAYLSFRERYAQIVRRKEELLRSGKHAQAFEVEGFLVSEYVRRTHAERGGEIVRRDFGGRLLYGTFNFAAKLAEVCVSHNWPASRLNELRTSELVGVNEHVNWRFVAIILRLADLLDFDAERTPAVLFRQLAIRDSVSLREWKKHRAITGWSIAERQIGFSAQCTDPVVEKTVRDFLSVITSELQSCGRLLADMHPEIQTHTTSYHIELPWYVDERDVGALEGPDGPLYEYLDTRFQLETDAVLSMLTGLRLYKNPQLFLRELLQNAVDTCLHRQSLLVPEYTPSIEVSLVTEGFEDGFPRIVVSDNGMGMSQEILKEYFAKIGKSYYRSPEFRAAIAAAPSQFIPVSQFGIGVLSAFMVGDHLIADTKFNTERPRQIEIADQGSLFAVTNGTRLTQGTTVTLRLTSSLEALFPPYKMQVVDSTRSTADAPMVHRLFSVASQLVPHSPVPIVVNHNGERIEVSSSFRLADIRGVTPWFHTITIDLSAKGPPGIAGMLRIEILDGEDRSPVIYRPLNRFVLVDGLPVLPRSDQYGDYFHAVFGSINRMTETRDGPNSSRVGGKPSFFPNGRLSQQGFAIQTNPFDPRADNPRIRIPFAADFDIDLSGDYTLPLSADRNAVLPSPDGEMICGEISRCLTALIVAECASLIQAYPTVFQGLHAGHQATDDHYQDLLRRLTEPRERSSGPRA